MKDLNRCFERISATLSLAGICGVYVIRVKLRKANGRENSKKMREGAGRLAATLALRMPRQRHM